MPNLTSVTVTAGVPTAGTGTVSTIDGLMADGGQATIGAKADAKSTATDTTAVSGMSVWKQISSSVQAAASSLASTLGVTQSGTWTVQPGNTANTTAWKVDNTAALDKGLGTNGSATQRVIVDTSQLATLGQAAMALSQPVVMASNQTWPTGMSNRAFSAVFTTLTRPANATAYTAADSISDNAIPGSVTALSATLSDTNDDPIFVNDILVSSTDTGLAGKRIRVYLFNSNPISSSGVVNGDNAAYSQKVAGYIGSFSGIMETGFSDGTVGRLVPSYNDGAAASTPNAPAGGFITALPTSGAKTVFIQFQAVDGFTPSGSSTTITARARGWQGRAS
jgi:hypothetical protein